MTFYALFLIGLSLSMDAFAISVTNGIAYPNDKRQTFISAASFGLAQAAMPVLGYLMGSSVSNLIEAYDHWVAFLLLALIGGKMLFDGLRALIHNTHPEARPLTVKLLFAQALATSIDALAVGISFAALKVSILPAAAIIGCTTFLCCIIGGSLGQRCGRLMQRYAILAGGVILVVLGFKILIEHGGI